MKYGLDINSLNESNSDWISAVVTDKFGFAELIITSNNLSMQLVSNGVDVYILNKGLGSKVNILELNLGKTSNAFIPEFVYENNWAKTKPQSKSNKTSINGVRKSKKIVLRFTNAEAENKITASPLKDTPNVGIDPSIYDGSAAFDNSFDEEAYAANVEGTLEAQGGPNGKGWLSKVADYLNPFSYMPRDWFDGMDDTIDTDPLQSVEALSASIEYGLTPAKVQNSVMPPVRLISNNSPSSSVAFTVQPDLNESRSVNYNTADLVHTPTSIKTYQNTAAVELSLSCKLISRNQYDADKNMARLATLRAWTYPYYGKGTGYSDITEDYLGAPPPVLTLFAYGSNHFDGVPVVITGLDVPWPSDANMVFTSEGHPIPVILNVSIRLSESWSPKQISNFDVNYIYAGQFAAAYNASPYEREEFIEISNTFDANKNGGLDPIGTIAFDPKDDIGTTWNAPSTTAHDADAANYVNSKNNPAGTFTDNGINVNSSSNSQAGSSWSNMSMLDVDMKRYS